MNVHRLKAYMTKLVVFPRNSTKPKKGDATAEERSQAQQLTGKLFPVQPAQQQLEIASVADATSKVCLSLAFVVLEVHHDVGRCLPHPAH